MMTHGTLCLLAPSSRLLLSHGLNKCVYTRLTGDSLSEAESLCSTFFGESGHAERVGFPVWLKPRPERAAPWKPHPIRANSDVGFTKAPPR